jgi:hypothetical protein
MAVMAGSQKGDRIVLGIGLIVSAFLAISAALSQSRPSSEAGYGPQITADLNGDCISDNSAILQQAVRAAGATSTPASRTRINVGPASNGCYVFASPVTLESNIELQAVGTALFRSAGTFLVVKGQSNIVVKGFTFDGQSNRNKIYAPTISVANSRHVSLINLTIVNATGQINLRDDNNILIQAPIIRDSLQHGVSMNNTHDSSVIDGHFEREVGFGIYLYNGSHGNLIKGNRTTQNGLELVGATQDTFQNRIVRNHAEGTGDNCISVSGSDTLVDSNEAIGCAGNGIGIYGERNVVTGNIVKNNAQKSAKQVSWRAGIAVIPAFGGSGQFNKVSGNVISDDQTVTTQRIGVWLSATFYESWTAHKPYKAGSYTFSKLALYKAEQDGTSGATAPTCLAGSCSDGSLAWRFVRSLQAGNALADYNEISSNKFPTAGQRSYLDQSGARHNSLVEDR